MVPVCMQLVLYPTHLEVLGCKVKSVLVGGKTSDLVRRDIKAVTRYGQYYVLDEHQNRHGHILQKAIAAHLAGVLQLRGKGVRYEMVERELDDTTQEKLNMVSKRTSDYWYDEDDGATMYEELNRMRIALLPKLQEWVEVEKGIYFQQYLQTSEEDEAGRDTAVRKTKEVAMVQAIEFAPLGSTLFENVKISRNMAQDGRMAVVEHLIRCGHRRWEDDTKTRCRIMWKKPAEWATTLSAKEHGMLGNVFTVYELYAGEETLGT
ncbi:hypothetical protein JG688_00017636, partial [Phytophthora aleatoria]